MIILMINVMLIYGLPILSFLQEKDLKKKCEILSVDAQKIIKRRKRDLIILLVILYFMPSDKQKYFLILIYLVYKQPYFKLMHDIKSLKEALNLQFAIWLRIMEVLLSYHTVVLAIEKSIESAPVLMRVKLKELVIDLKEDPLNRDVYVNFMSEYDDLNIERSMHHLYRYAVMGSSDANVQLTNMIEDNAKELIRIRSEMFESRLNFYSWFGLVPMLLVSLSFLGLMFMVLTNLMEGGWSI